VPLFTYGAYVGLIFERKVFKTRFLSLYVESRINILKFLGRILVVAVLVFAYGLLLYLIPWTLSLAILVIIKNLLPAILAGFSIFAFSSYFWRRFNLIEQ
jgi:hypothetical protein